MDGPLFLDILSEIKNVEGLDLLRKVILSKVRNNFFSSILVEKIGFIKGLVRLRQILT